MSTTMESAVSEKEKGFRLLQAQRARKAAEVRAVSGFPETRRQES
jgi:hypothetical protein